MKQFDKKSVSPDLYSRNTLISYLVEKLLNGQYKNKKSKLLDVGGYGTNLHHYVEQIDEFTILEKKAKPAQLDDKIKYVEGSILKAPFSDRAFDVVVSTDMIEHLDKPDRPPAVRELLRVAKKYLILGMPCKNDLTENAERIVNDMFATVTGKNHEFLNEHIHYGLPKEERIEQVIKDMNLPYFKINEGNLMNWYIQYLYTSSQMDQLHNEKKFEFNRFYNENLFRLGNLRAPTYRTFFVVANDGYFSQDEIMSELADQWKWEPQAFMELLKKAFQDMRISMNRGAKLLQVQNQLTNLQVEYEKEHARFEHTKKQLVEKDQIIQKARASMSVYIETIAEARDVLTAREKKIKDLNVTVEDKNQKLVQLVQKFEQLKSRYDQKEELLSSLKTELREKEEKNSLLREHVLNKENILGKQSDEILTLKQRLHEVEIELHNHHVELVKVINSRAWKFVMTYGKIKNTLITKPLTNLKKGTKILFNFGPKEFGKRVLKKIKSKRNIDFENDFKKYIALNSPTSTDFILSQKDIANWEYKPVISLIVPVFNVEKEFLEKMLHSVQKQWYDKWELCICDDGSTMEHIKPALRKLESLDSRVKVYFRKQNGGIVKASNDALKLASGAYVGFLDNDDELAPEALYEVVKTLQEKKYDLIYSDEDKMSVKGERSEPYFKPEYSPDLLLSTNYINHFSVYRKKLIDELKGLREGYEGSQDYDLLLRFTEKTNAIKHIPKILYHWRKVPGSAAESVNAKPIAWVSAKKALNETLKRREIKGEVLDGLWTGSFRIRREIKSKPKVSIIIPFKDKTNLLKQALSSIFEKTKYENFEIILVNNQSETLEMEEYLKSINNPIVKVIDFKGEFNYSAINNLAAIHASGEYLLLMNNDVEVIHGDWMEAMLEQAIRPEVGAVGPKLLYPNNTVQHAGAVIGLMGLANHSFYKYTADDHGYFGLANAIRNVSAVTGACLMTRKDVFLKLGGLDQNNLKVGFNDMDYCLRLREKGYSIIYTPYAKLYHHEHATRGKEIDPEEVKFFQRKHRAILKNGDPYYNPNLTLERMDYSLRISDTIQN